MKRLSKLLGFILLPLAIVLSILVFPIGWAYSLFRLKTKLSRLNYYAFKIALSIDQLGNVVMSTLFNDFFIKDSGYKFGDEDETISRVLGINKYEKTLLPLGKALSWILNLIDKNHVEKASEDYIKTQTNEEKIKS